MKKLKPLTEICLTTQLADLLGLEHWGINWEIDPIKNTVRELSTNTVFLLATPQEEEEYKKSLELKKLEEKRQKSHKYDNHPNVIIDYNNGDRWDEGLEHLKKGIVEMCEEAYYHFLEVLPPLRLNGWKFLTSEASHHNKNGEAVYIACTKKDGRYIATYASLKEFENSPIFEKDFKAL